MLLNCLQKTISSVEIMRISLTPISRQNVTGRKKTQLGTLSMKRRIFIAKFDNCKPVITESRMILA